jgi:AraC-like DNA-binding protein
VLSQIPHISLRKIVVIESSKVLRPGKKLNHRRLATDAASVDKVEKQHMLSHRGDALSQVLKLVRLRGDIIFHGELGARTEVTFPPGPAGFLHLRDGEALISQRDGKQVLLKPGDFVLLLHTDGYTLRDGASGETRRRIEANVSFSPCQQTHTVRCAANQDIAGCFLAGAFHFNGEPLRSLLTGLPGIIHVKCDSDDMPPWIATISQFLTDESGNVGPGSSLMISRLIDLLVIRTLRTWINNQGSRLGWLFGLSDERIGRALNAMHLEPSRAWTVESLAGTAAMSRSIFSNRFTAAVGVPPLRYLTRWRLSIAAELLHAGKFKVAEVAQKAGYGSEAAFSRAFKAEFGYPPRDTRRMAQAEIFRARMP